MKKKHSNLLKYGAFAAIGYVVLTKLSSSTGSGTGANAVGAYVQRGSRHFMRVRGSTRALRPS